MLVHVKHTLFSLSLTLSLILLTSFSVQMHYPISSIR